MTHIANAPAFPSRTVSYVRATPDGHIDPVYQDSTGMTLRQHYAGLAMQGIMSAEGQDVVYSLEMVATRSVAIADALIAELEKEQAGG